VSDGGEGGSLTSCADRWEFGESDDFGGFFGGVYLGDHDGAMCGRISCMTCWRRREWSGHGATVGERKVLNSGLRFPSGERQLGKAEA
jgi:hypothetical protein